MSTINYYLKPFRITKQGKQESLVILNYLSRGKKFRLSTKIKVDPKYWKNQRLKVQCIGATEINALLDNYENLLREIEREALFLKKEYTIEIIKRKFENKIASNRKGNDFFNAFNDFITESTSIKAKNTIKAYVGTRNQLLKFQEYKEVQITFESISTEFYNDFVDYLINRGRYLNNTIGKHIKILKTFLNHAKENDFFNSN